MSVGEIFGLRPRLGKRVLVASGAVVLGDVEHAREIAERYVGYKDRYLAEGVGRPSWTS